MNTTQPRDPRFSLPRPVPSEVKRSALLRRMKGGQYRLIVLEAPAGYGKTTVLSQYVRSCPHPVVWLTLAPDDADLARLCSSLAGSLAWHLPRLAPLHVEASPSGARQLASRLAGSGHHLSLVLDNADDLSDAACQWLMVFAGQLPEGVTLLLAHRGTAPLRAVRLLLAGSAVRLDEADLRFGAAEAGSLLRGHPQALQAAHFNEQFGGWAATLALAARTDAAPLGVGALLEEALDMLPDALCAAVPRLAVLDVWSLARAREAQLCLPPGWLEQLRRAGLPLAALGQGEWRPHQLLGQVLEDRLAQQPELHSRLHAQAAQWALDRQAWLAAVRHQHAAGHFEAMNATLARVVPDWRQRQEWSGLVRLLSPLASSLWPQWQAVLGQALVYQGQAEGGMAIFHGLLARGQADVTTYGMLGLAERRAYRTDAAMTFFERGLAASQTENDRFRLEHQMVLAQHEGGRLSDPEAALTGLVCRAAQLDDPHLHLACLGHWQWYLLNQSRYQEAFDSVQRSFALVERTGNSLLAEGPAEVQLLYCYTQDQPDQMDALIQRWRPEWEALDFVEGQNVLLRWESLACQLRGDYVQSVCLHEQLLQAHQASGSTNLLADALAYLSYALLRLGRLTEAQAVLARWQREQGELQRSWRLILEGMLALAQGQPEAALRLLEEADEAGTDFSLRRLLYRAEAHRQLGSLRRAHIADLVETSDRLGFAWPLRQEAEPLRELYRLCVQRGWSAERFAPYLADGGQGDAPRWAVEVQSLGALRVVAGGREVRFGYGKAAELLVFLAVHGPASPEAIAEALWDSDRVTRAYDAARHLRRGLEAALGAGEPLLRRAGGRYHLHPDLRVQLDALQLEHGSPDDPPARLDLYGGDFLPGQPSEWAGQQRRALRQRAARLARHLAEAHEASAPDQALRWSRRAVEIDPEAPELLEHLERLSAQLNEAELSQRVALTLERLAHGDDPRPLWHHAG